MLDMADVRTDLFVVRVRIFPEGILTRSHGLPKRPHILKCTTKNITRQIACSAPVPTLNPQTNSTRPRVVSLTFLALVTIRLGRDVLCWSSTHHTPFLVSHTVNSPPHATSVASCTSVFTGDVSCSARQRGSLEGVNQKLGMKGFKCKLLSAQSLVLNPPWLPPDESTAESCVYESFPLLIRRVRLRRGTEPVKGSLRLCQIWKGSSFGGSELSNSVLKESPTEHPLCLRSLQKRVADENACNLRENGRSPLFKFPVPSWPFLLLPKAKLVPSSVTTTVCCLPAAAFTILYLRRGKRLR